jgi:hypothetical protein
MHKCIYCGHEHNGRKYPCPECGPEEEAYDRDIKLEAQEGGRWGIE